jgi:precorrin-4 methylase
MSYNNLVNILTKTNEIIPKETQDENIEQKVILTREEKLDKFLESTVVDKFKQKWKDLTPFLRTNRIKMYIEELNEDSNEIEKQALVRKINNLLMTGKLKNNDILYDAEEGKIISVKGF